MVIRPTEGKLICHVLERKEICIGNQELEANAIDSKVQDPANQKSWIIHPKSQTWKVANPRWKSQRAEEATIEAIIEVEAGGDEVIRARPFCDMRL
jgi:hypothetical protein